MDESHLSFHWLGLTLLTSTTLTRELTEPQLADNLCTPNIARVFGTKTSAFELLVLKRKIMGPCWLEIKKPEVKHNGVCD